MLVHGVQLAAVGVVSGVGILERGQLVGQTAAAVGGHTGILLGGNGKHRQFGGQVVSIALHGQHFDVVGIWLFRTILLHIRQSAEGRHVGQELVVGVLAVGAGDVLLCTLPAIDVTAVCDGSIAGWRARVELALLGGVAQYGKEGSGTFAGVGGAHLGQLGLGDVGGLQMAKWSANRRGADRHGRRGGQEGQGQGGGGGGELHGIAGGNRTNEFIAFLRRNY